MAPFSRQFALAAAAACPLLSTFPFLRRPLTAALNAWLRRLYATCSLSALAPDPAGPLLFTGQCHDGWFGLAKAGKLRVVAGSVSGVEAGGVVVGGVEADTGSPAPPSSTFLPADIVVVALGCALNSRPPFLAGLGVEEGEEGAGVATTGARAGLGLPDLHSFAFFGRRPRLGLVCDWVWFNVPHGPKQLSEERGRRELEREALLHSQPPHVSLYISDKSPASGPASPPAGLGPKRKPRSRQP